MSLTLVLMNSPHVSFSQGAAANEQIVLRLIHLVAGITGFWSGHPVVHDANDCSLKPCALIRIVLNWSAL